MTRPVSFDAEGYKHGIVVERFFNRMKTARLGETLRQARRLLRGSVVLAAIVDWLR